MWGLLLALTAFAPPVGPGLGASSTSVLDLAPPATPTAPGSAQAPRSSLAQTPAKGNGTSGLHVQFRVIKKKKVIVKKRKKLVRPSPLVTARPLVTTVSAGTLNLPEKQEPGCPPLGLESLRVSDSQLEASSSQSFGLGPHRGRLNIQSGLEDGDLYDGAWCAEQQDTEPWFQVDAKKPICFSGIVTQGRNSVWRYDWVTSFKVQFSNDSQTWWRSRNHSSGVDAVFPANSDPDTSVLNLLPEPQVARFIRLLPQTWLQEGAPCLRAEILACPISDSNDPLPEAHAIGSFDPLDFRHHNYKAMRKVRYNPYDPGKKTYLFPSHQDKTCCDIPCVSCPCPTSPTSLPTDL